MNADQMINHMMTVIYTTADVEGIQVTRHFRPQEIVDSTLAACQQYYRRQTPVREGNSGAYRNVRRYMEKLHSACR